MMLRQLLLTIFFTFGATTTYTLDQLSDDEFTQIARRAVFFTDHITVFSLASTNTKLLAQTGQWCKNEQDADIITHLLFHACYQKETWPVAFVLRHAKVTSEMVGWCVSAEHTPAKSQQLLSKECPLAIEDGWLGNKQFENFDTHASVFLKNGFAVFTLRRKNGPDIPTLNHLLWISCTQQHATNDGHNFINDYSAPCRYKEIKCLLEYGANPSYRDKLNEDMAATDLLDNLYGMEFMQKERAQKYFALLNKYKREPENTIDIVYPDKSAKH